MYKTLPEVPGVYIFRNKSKKVIYVGKAINLKSRVSSYFLNKHLLDPKTAALVTKIESVEHIEVKNEIEALLLESELIKRYKPPYNINLKDDKFYKYIYIDNESPKKIGTTRKISNKKNKYFGPFPESTSIFIILKTLRRIFPYRDCSQAKFNRYKNAKRPCLYGHIGLCAAPCQGEREVEKNDENIKKIAEYLSGDRKALFNKIEREMKIASKNLEFEKAAYLRDQVASYNYLTQEIGNIREYIEVPQTIEIQNNDGVSELIKVLQNNTPMEFDKNVRAADFRIETFDISNNQGKNAVGAMVVTIGGAPDKTEYRRFKIRAKDTPNDFEMMKEMLTRRFSRKEDQPKWNDPDLIVIDGGKGQLTYAIEALQKTNKQFPIIGLAKREEEIIFVNEKGEYEILKLKPSSIALNILKKGRDEAHRFGITYYRKLHRKKLLAD